MNRYRFYTGPCIVKQVADQLRAKGIIVYLEGTAHVYFMTQHSVQAMMALLPTWVKAHDLQPSH